MSVSGVSSALSTLTGGSAESVQQTITAKVLRDQIDSEAVMTAQLLESGKQISQSVGIGSRVDFRA